MGKSRAEIQRAYRERLKEKNKEEYLRKERERKRRNYVSSHQLSENDREKRNRKNRANLREFYARKRAERSRVERSETSGYESRDMNDDTGIETSDEHHTRSRENETTRGRLLVRMTFNNEINKGKQKAALKRWKRDRSAAVSRIRILEQERDKLKTKLKSTQRALQRARTRTRSSDTMIKESELTPSKQTEHDMEAANLTVNQKEKLRRPILLGNVIVSEIKATKKNTPRDKKAAIHNIIAGKITKKYKSIKYLSQKTGLGRNQLGRVNCKEHQIRPKRRVNKLEKCRESVVNFLKREDNSRVQPGKSDAKTTVKGRKQQIQILTDYLKNLYLKFKSENPNINISFTTFCRSRPSYIYKTAMLSRVSCLCFKHQNASLLVKALRKYVEITANPEKVSEKKLSEDMLREKLPDEVTVSQWTRIETEDKGKKKTVTRIVENIEPRDKFIEQAITQLDDFKEHVERVHVQYEQIKVLKQTIPEHHFIIQLDFAENYTCRSHEEVQSAYFNQSTVTLHPMVAYWKNTDGILQHKSFITISDEASHKASTVLTFIDDLIPELKVIDPQLKMIHYWSDSPSSQYRNKYIFDAVANHFETYGCNARWNYFESGHGKGPCDGLGGTSKRMADEASRSGRYVISDAHDFFKWGTTSNMTNVTFRFVSREKCEAKAELIASRNVKSVAGTMKLHAVVGLGQSKILHRITSCYCSECLAGDFCNSWSNASTYEVNKCPTGNNANKRVEEKCTKNSDIPEAAQVVYKIDDFVAAVYQDKWYIGKIIDCDDTEVEINFMQQKKKLFQWPTHKDQIWIKKEDVLCTMPPPNPNGKSGRMFKFCDDAMQSVQSFFEEHLKTY